MPTSWYHACSVVVEKVMSEYPMSVLDIGVGFGKYGALLREALDIPYERYEKEQWIARIDGVEAFAGYRNPLHEYTYNTIYYQPIAECLDSLGSYDVILMSDVLEHMPKEEALALLERLLGHAIKAIVALTPLNPAPAGPYLGNEYERHVSRFTPVDFAKFENDFVMVPIMGNNALIVKLYSTEHVRDRNAVYGPTDGDLLRLVGEPPRHTEKLHIAYALPHQELTGGLKMLLEQIDWLKSKGHTVDAYLCGNADSALPGWKPVSADGDTVIHDGSFGHHIKPCDVIVAGWYEQIPDLLGTGLPVMYWEQGNEMLFGDYHGILHTAGTREAQRQLFSLPVILTSVSRFVADVMKWRYNRDTVVIPNGVNTELYQPAPKPEGDPIIMLVGNPLLPFKRFSTALKILRQLWEKGRRFRVRWVCQYHPHVTDVPFPLETLVRPDQRLLAELYATADILLFLSIFEGFGMPPLEAMAAGAAVVCSDCGGAREYLKDGDNALVVQPEDETAIFEAVDRLIGDPGLREQLAMGGRATALEFSLDKSFCRLEEVLYAIRDQRRGGGM